MGRLIAHDDENTDCPGPSDGGTIFITHEDDNKTATLRVRAPQSTYEAKISLPLEHWLAMTEGSWAIGQRQAWIAEMVGIYGFINREHIMRKFGVSVPQASVDLRTFQEQNPNAIFYNSSTKRYELRHEPREIVTPELE